MLKEYLERVDLENSEELDKLQVQMKSLLDELNTKQEIIDKLRREKNLDINIFSPRSMDAEADEKIEKAMKEKLEINQKIEYVRGLIETYTKKKMEYEELRKELMESDIAEKEKINTLTENNQNRIETEESDILTAQIEIKTKKTDIQTDQIEIKTEKSDIQTDQIETEYVEKENGAIEDQNAKESIENLEKKDSSEPERTPVDRKALHSFLDEIYRQTERCMATASNRNQCKTELRNLKNKIKNYAAKIEVQD